MAFGRMDAPPKRITKYEVICSAAVFEMEAGLRDAGLGTLAGKWHLHEHWAGSTQMRLVLRPNVQRLTDLSPALSGRWPT